MRDTVQARDHTDHVGLRRLARGALRRVRAFNADTELRTCPKCGGVHPPIYGFYADVDDAIEHAAREAG
jgi:hypothetical protein